MTGKRQKRTFKHVGDGAVFTGTTALRYRKTFTCLLITACSHPSFRAGSGNFCLKSFCLNSISWSSVVSTKIRDLFLGQQHKSHPTVKGST